MAPSKSKYDKPDLREKIKARIMAGTKGGAAGQWSARKAQLLALEYKKAGGGYTSGKSATQKSLTKWTKEEWTTSDGKPAIRQNAKGEKITTRYLPKKAWENMTAAEKKATNAKKVQASKQGQQFVANTKTAKARGKAARQQKK